MEIEYKFWPKRPGNPERLMVYAIEGGRKIGETESFFGKPSILLSDLEANDLHELADIVRQNRSRSVGILYGIGVSEAFRRRGIGTALVRETFELLRERNVSGVYVQPEPRLEVPKESLIEFYERAGFNFRIRTGADVPVLYRDLINPRRAD